MTIRLLTEKDVAAAAAISAATGWNQTEQDWGTLLALNPDSCVGVECDGTLAATATLSCYGRQLAWIGMVLTQPEFRGRGFARQLLERLLAESDAREILTVKLDATEVGQPIYESLGFITEQPVERWVRPREGPGPEDSLATVGTPARGLDTQAFGADREMLLHHLAERAATLTAEQGYVMRRNGVRAAYLGPCVARAPETAEQLIRAALGQHSGPWFWDLMPENAEAVRLAARLGFTVARKLVRMYRGEPLRAKESWIYALAGLEFG